jgi:hypothetical protein
MDCNPRAASQAPGCAPAERRVEPGERGIGAPLTVMDRFVLHELPREQGKCERGSVPIDQRVNVDGFQCSEQLSLLVVKRAEERRASQRADIVVMLARPIDFSGRQRGIVDTAHTDDVSQLLAKRRESVAYSMRYWCPVRFSGRLRRSPREPRAQNRPVKPWSTLLYRAKSWIDIV